MEAALSVCLSMFLLVSAEAVLCDARVVDHLVLGLGGDGEGVEAGLSVCLSVCLCSYL